MIVDTHPEFGIELVLSVPYAYWLHTQNKIDKVITSKGMKPFYYFCNDVEEKYQQRTIDNAAAGLGSLPNDWLHHNATAMFGKSYNDLNEDEKNKANGVLDYKKWSPPPFKDYYKNDIFKFDKEIIVINNSCQPHSGTHSTRYFSIECLYEIFTYLTEKGYKVIYNRPLTKSLPTQDQNELFTPHDKENIEAVVEGIGLINDYKLTEYFDDVILIEDLHKQNPSLDFNKLQCMVYANCDKFISYIGGAGILASYFKGTSIMWLSQGGESRTDYFSKDSYYKKLSGCNIILEHDKQKTYPHKIENYKNFIQTIKNTF